MANRKKMLTSAQLDEAVTLWATGMTIPKMAEQLSLSTTFLGHFIYRNREFFPARRNGPIARVDKPRVKQAEPEEVEAPIVLRQLPPDRVIRFTREGAKITMPRITMIDGPAP